MPKNLITKLEPGDVVLFYEKTVKEDKAVPDHKLAVLESKLFIFQGYSCPGGGDLFLQFANATETRGRSASIFSKENWILLPKDQAPEVVKEGFGYVFAM